MPFFKGTGRTISKGELKKKLRANREKDLAITVRDCGKIMVRYGKYG